MKEAQIEKLKSLILKERISNEKITSEIIQYKLYLSDSKAELNALNDKIKEIKKNNPQIALKLKSSPLETIITKANDIDITKHYDNTSMTYENINTLISNGDYLKTQAGILYYLSLIERKYKGTKFLDEINMISPESNIIMDSSDRDSETNENRIKVNFNYANNTSFIVSFDEEEKRKTFTFDKLKKESCDMWNISQSDRYRYHIINDLKQIYSSHLLVKDVKRRYFELCDIASLNNINIKKEKFITEPNDINEDTNESTERVKDFISVIEDYTLFYRKAEGIYMKFKKDEELERININHITNIENIKKKQEIHLENNDIDEYENEVQKENEENENYENMIYEHKNKREKPIYISSLHILLYKQLIFFNFIFQIILAASFFYTVDNICVFTSNQITQGKTFVNKALFFNPTLKYFFKDTSAFETEKINNLINTKHDLLLWFTVVFNNMLFQSSLYSNDNNEYNLDYYNNFLFLNSTVYEQLLGSRIIFKLAKQSENENDLITFDNNLLNNELLFINDNYNEVKEDTSPKSICINQTSFDLLSSIGNQMCYSDCISNKQIIFSNNSDIVKISQGILAEYETKGFILNLGDNMTRIQMNNVLSLVKRELISNKALRAIIININIVNTFSENLIKTDIIFELSSFGDVIANIVYTFVDTFQYYKSSGLIFKMIGYVLEAVFILKALYSWICYICKPKRISLSFMRISLDLVIISFMIYEHWLISRYLTQMRDIQEEYEIDETTTKTFSNRFIYKEFVSFTEYAQTIRDIGCFCTILLFFRIIIAMTSITLVQFILRVVIYLMRKCFNLILLLFIFLLSFTIVMHSMLGPQNENLSSFPQTLLMSLLTILGFLDTSSFGSLNDLNMLILISFLFVLKFFFMIFIFAIIKISYEGMKRNFSMFKKSKFFLLYKEFPYEFLKNIFVPISTYFTVREALRQRKVFSKANFERMINEGEVNTEIVFAKLEIDDRDVYYFYERTK